MQNKIDFKLVNLLLISLILFVFFMTKDLWLTIITFFIKIFFPFFISFIISYFLYPLTKFLMNKTNKILGIILTIFCIILFLILIVFLVGPVVYKEFTTLIYTLIKTLTNVSIKYNINLSNYLDILFEYFFNKKIDIFDVSYNFISNLIMIIILTIYFLIYMEKIRNFIKKVFSNFYELLKIIDLNITNYSNACLLTSVITFVEYYFAYLLIGHKESLLLAFLASLLNIIPVFGGLICGVVGIVLASQISKQLVIKTIIMVVLCSFLDSYVINPIIFKKSNNLNPFITIIGIIVFGNLFGIIGIILAVPLVIIIKEVIEYFK